MGGRTVVQCLASAAVMLLLFAPLLAGCSGRPRAADPASTGAGSVEAATATIAVGGSQDQAVAGVSRAAPTPSATGTPTDPEAQPTATPIAVATLPLPSDPFARMELDRYTVRPGQSVGLRGYGFQPGERVRVFLSPGFQDPLGEAQADSLGRFAIPSLRIPGYNNGERTIAVEGQTSGTLVARSMSIVGYNPWGVLDRYAVAPGESIGFSGHGFAPNEQLRIYLDGDRSRPVATAMANDRGEVRLQQVLTPSPEDVGAHRLAFEGQSSGVGFEASFTVQGKRP